MEITYSSTRCDQWRCNLYSILLRPQSCRNLLVFLVLTALCHAWLARPSSRVLGWEMLLIFMVALLGAILIHALLLHAEIAIRLPTPVSQRICTTRISPASFQDIMLEKTLEYRWDQITDIRLRGGDFYFWIGDTKANFIPKTAFDDRRDAQLFFETAVQYWRAAKSGQAAVLPSRDGVWPPAPRQ